ncbi:MAG: PAAR domain-containing protein [Phycisphaerales bacterium]
MVTGNVPHEGGPILPQGSPDVQIEYKAAARATDKLLCKAGGPDVLNMGSPNVLINNLRAVRKGDTTLHGGVVTGGASTVIIGVAGDGVVVDVPVASDATAKPKRPEGGRRQSEEPETPAGKPGKPTPGGNATGSGKDAFPRAAFVEIPIPESERSGKRSGSRRFRCVSVGDRDRPGSSAVRITDRRWEAHGLITVPVRKVDPSSPLDIEVEIDGEYFLLHRKADITLSLEVTNEFGRKDETSQKLETAYAIAIIDGTGPWSKEGYEAAMMNSFCSQLRSCPIARYERGPSGEGFRVVERAQRAAEFLSLQHEKRLVLAGYSRGGSAAVIAARILEQRGLDVDLLLLFDPVDRGSGDSSVISSNVANAWIASREADAPEMDRYDCSLPGDPAGHNPVRQWFGATATSSEAASTNRRSFLGSHGALGGVGWPHVREDPACQMEVAAFMNGALQSAGITVPLVSYAPAASPPLTIEFWDRFLELYSAFRATYPLFPPYMTGGLQEVAVARFEQWIEDHGVADREQREAMKKSFRCKVNPARGLAG